MKYFILALMVVVPSLATAAPGTANMTKARKAKVRAKVAKFMKKAKAQLPDVDVSRSPTCLETSTPRQPNQPACIAVYRTSTAAFACVPQALKRVAKKADFKCIARPKPAHQSKKPKKQNSAACLSLGSFKKSKRKRRTCDVENVEADEATATSSVKPGK